MIINYFYTDALPRVLHQEVEPYKYGTNKGYHKCFAHKWSVMNRFKLKCPIEIDFTVAPKEDGEFLITYNNNTKSMLGKILNIDLMSGTVYKDKLVFQLHLGMCFYSKEKCFIEQCHPEESLPDLKMIKGKFDISKWCRPFNVAFELQKKHQRVTITRQHTICEIVFYADKINESIRLKENTNPSPRFIDFVNSNSRVTDYVTYARPLLEKGKELLRRFF